MEIGCGAFIDTPQKLSFWDTGFRTCSKDTPKGILFLGYSKKTVMRQILREKILEKESGSRPIPLFFGRWPAL